jgi:hypothetical protein
MEDSQIVLNEKNLQTRIEKLKIIKKSHIAIIKEIDRRIDDCKKNLKK